LINPLGSFESVTLTYPAPSPLNARVSPGSPGWVRIAIVLGANTVVSGAPVGESLENSQTIQLTLDSAFSATPSTVTVHASSDAEAASWSSASSLLTLTARRGVTKNAGDTFVAYVQLTMPVSGTTMLPKKVNWDFASIPDNCQNGVVERNSSNYLVMTGFSFGSLRPTSIRYGSGGGSSVPGTVTSVTLSFRVGGMNLEPTDKISVTLPGFGGTGTGSNNLFDYSFAAGILDLNPKTRLSAGSAEITTVIGEDARITLPINGVSSSDHPGITIKASAADAPPAEQIGSQDTSGFSFSCQTVTVAATGTTDNLCNAEYDVRMCATDVDAVSAYITDKRLREAGGYVPLTAAALSSTGNVTGGGASAEAVCKSRSDSQCAAAKNGLVSFAFRPTTSASALASDCCESNPATATMGIGSLRTCFDSTDCGYAGMAPVSLAIRVAKVDRICCDFCKKWYGITGCVDSSGRRPGEADASVVAFCENILQCVAPKTGPCFGFSTSAGTLEVPLGIGGQQSTSVTYNDFVALPETLNVKPGQEVANAREYQPRGEQFPGAGATIVFSIAASRFESFPALLAAIRAALSRRSGDPLLRRQDETSPNERVESADWLVIYQLNGTAPAQTWVPVGPTGAVEVAGGQIRAFVLVNTLETYVPFVIRGLPRVETEFDKHITTSGNEVYSTICVASFLLLLSFVIVLLPCCMPESTKPPLPSPPVPREAPPAPVVISPPPPPPAPVFVREVEPQMRYNVQGAPIKHFGPPIGGSGWKPAPQTEYSVPIRTSPETEGQLGFSDGYGGGGTSFSEAPQAASRAAQQQAAPGAYSSPPVESHPSQGKPYGYG